MRLILISYWRVWNETNLNFVFIAQRFLVSLTELSPVVVVLDYD